MPVGLTMVGCGFEGVLLSCGTTTDLAQGVWLVERTVSDPFSIALGIDKRAWQVCCVHFEVYDEERVAGTKALPSPRAAGTKAASSPRHQRMRLSLLALYEHALPLIQLVAGTRVEGVGGAQVW